jgi:hypothetical protein
MTPTIPPTTIPMIALIGREVDAEEDVEALVDEPARGRGGAYEKVNVPVARAFEVVALAFEPVAPVVAVRMNVSVVLLRQDVSPFSLSLTGLSMCPS